MPLNAKIPSIDDRRYSDILDELRTRGSSLYAGVEGVDRS